MVYPLDPYSFLHIGTWLSSLMVSESVEETQTEESDEFNVNNDGEDTRENSFSRIT